MKTKTILLMLFFLCSHLFTAEVTFTKKPTAAKKDGRMIITFAVSVLTDVEVSILDKDKTVVRHLAAGMLGKNPPPPLKANSLSQTIAWDGKDDNGKQPPAGNFSVRVSLGLKAELDTFFGAHDLDGSEFAVDNTGDIYIKNGWNVRVFSRDGVYKKTIMPFPANLTQEQVKGLNPVKLSDTKYLPRIYSTEALFTYPSSMRGDASRIMITSDGTLVLEGLDYKPHVMGYHHVYTGLGRRLLFVNKDGSFPRPHLGPYIMNCSSPGISWSIAQGPGPVFYVTNIIGKGLYDKTPHHAVYRVNGYEGKTELFLGEQFKSGNDNTHFNNPVSAAADSKGNVYISDRGNNRIAVFSSAGKFLSSISVEKPARIIIHPKTDALYAAAGNNPGGKREVGFRGGKLVKFTSYKSAKPQAETALNPKGGRCLALDYSVTPSVLLVSGPKGIVKYEDTETGFKQIGPLKLTEKNSKPYKGLAGQHIAIDKINDGYYVKRSWSGWSRIDGVTGNARKAFGWRVSQISIGPDTNIYYRELQKPVTRIDYKTRKPVVFPATGKAEPEGEVGYEKAWEKKDGYGARGFYVAQNGNIYYMQSNYVAVWSSDGKLINKHLIKTDGMPCGAAADRKGNVYIGVNFKLKNKYYPEELMGKVDAAITKKGDPFYNWYPVMYGSLIKFSPDGGSVKILKKGEKAPEGSIEGIYGLGQPGFVQGSQWFYTGLSPIWSGHPTCQCVVPRFDIDGFGRIFLPDAAQFCVKVLDEQGNYITRFGQYSNWDSQGEGSMIPEPAIPFGFPTQVGISKNGLYVLDRLNMRVVKVKLGYAAEETCTIR